MGNLQQKVMDVAILAGGYGTRLKGLWDGPKCLVPYKGRPVIELIVNKALELKPRKIFLLLGYKASAVVKWREDCCPHRDVVPIIETEPLGTASAIRNALPFISVPLTVLNGDTVPSYDLSEFILAYYNNWRGIAATWSGNKYAGTSIFGLSGLKQIEITTDHDLDYLINDPRTLHFPVPGFIDLGTPAAFKKAQQE